MIERTLTGVLGTLVIVSMATVGVWALVANYVLESPGALFLPSLATLIVTSVVVFGLFALGARSDRWLQNPYW
ncbi:hypothetical protein [Natrononativus amylolyticus]|uniref:hypothetical protein n=1 Tax=Natrononativus amylolyticus TaxID=2963434 RepID=UPI0020CEC916|nr:hypothetical protein [Natrononativus amylolyticus]